MATKSNGNVPVKKRAPGAKVAAKKVALAKAAVKKVPAKKTVAKVARKTAVAKPNARSGDNQRLLVPLSYAVGQLVVRGGIVGVIDNGEFVSFKLQVNRPVCILVSQNLEVGIPECVTSLRRAIKGIRVNFVSNPPDEICCNTR